MLTCSMKTINLSEKSGLNLFKLLLIKTPYNLLVIFLQRHKVPRKLADHNIQYLSKPYQHGEWATSENFLIISFTDWLGLGQ